MDWSALVIPAYITALFAAFGWVLKRRLDRIEDKQDQFTSTQHACQVGNEQRFATWDQHNKLSAAVVNHGERISALEARRP